MSTVKANDLQTTTGGIPTVKSQQLIPTAWVNFNGQDTVAIRGSENVSSITDLSVGHYNINYSSSLANVNYSIAGSAGSPSTRYGRLLAPANGVKTTSSVGIRTEPSHLLDSGYDHNEISVIIFGGQA